MIVKTKTCMVCGKSSQVELTEKEYQAYASGAFIQDALPERDADFRELLISGTHPVCWDTLFGDEEED